MSALSYDDFTDAFRHVLVSAFRLESNRATPQPDEADDFARWERGETSPIRDHHTDQWLANVADKRDHGVTWQRVRLVHHPLNPYTQWELLELTTNVSAGEDVRILNLNHHRHMTAINGRDYWAFDLGTPSALIVWLDYDPDGLLARIQPSTSIGDFAWCAWTRQRALHLATPLPKYLEAVSA